MTTARTFIYITVFFITGILSGFLTSNFSPSISILTVSACAIFGFAFIKQEFGLYILIASMLLSPEISIGTTAGASLGRGVTLRVDDFLIAVIGLSWFAKNAVYKDLGLFRKSALNASIFAYIFVCSLSTIIGIFAGRIDAKTGFFFVLKYIEYFIVYFMILNYAEDLPQIKRFITAMLLTCFITCIIGLLQIPQGGRVSAPFEGEIGEPNTFGGYLLFMGCIAAGLFSTSDRSRVKILLMALIALILPVFLYTQSRASYLGLIPAMCVLALFSERKFLILALMASSIIVSPLFLPQTVKNRILYTVQQPEERGQIQIGTVRIDTSTSARLMSWKRAILDWTRHPVLGYGVTGYSFIDAQFPRILVETGIVGLSAFVFILYSIFKLAFNRLESLKNPYSIGLVRGFIAGYVGLLFHAIGSNTFIIVRIMEPFWFVMGIIVVLPVLEHSWGVKRDNP